MAIPRHREPARSPPRRRPRPLQDERRAAGLLVGPALAGLLFFIALPFLAALFLSVTNYRLGSPLDLELVGLRQYARIFTDDGFLHALLNNVLFALVVVPLQTAMALGLAVLVNQRLRGMVVFRTLFFAPVVFPLSLVAVVFMLIFAPGPDGICNNLMEWITLGAWEPRNFLHDPWLALPAIMVTSIWQGVGFQMVVLLAGLQDIPRELYDAATVDGAGAWQRFRHVTLPQLRGPLIFVVVVTTILSFRVFDQVRIMTSGGPRHATTTVLFESVQAAFDRGWAARGAAMSVVFFAIVLGITLIQRRLVRQEQP